MAMDEAELLSSVLTALEADEESALLALHDAISKKANARVQAAPMPTGPEKFAPAAFDRCHDFLLSMFVMVCGSFVVPRRSSDASASAVPSSLPGCMVGLLKAVDNSVSSAAAVLRQFVSSPLFPALPFPDTITRSFDRKSSRDNVLASLAAVDTAFQSTSRQLQSVAAAVTESYRVSAAIIDETQGGPGIIVLLAVHVLCYCGLARSALANVRAVLESVHPKQSFKSCRDVIEFTSKVLTISDTLFHELAHMKRSWTRISLDDSTVMMALCEDAMTSALEWLAAHCISSSTQLCATSVVDSVSVGPSGVVAKPHRIVADAATSVGIDAAVTASPRQPFVGGTPTAAAQSNPALVPVTSLQACGILYDIAALVGDASHSRWQPLLRDFVDGLLAAVPATLHTCVSTVIPSVPSTLPRTQSFMHSVAVSPAVSRPPEASRGAALPAQLEEPTLMLSLAAMYSPVETVDPPLSASIRPDAALSMSLTGPSFNVAESTGAGPGPKAMPPRHPSAKPSPPETSESTMAVALPGAMFPDAAVRSPTRSSTTSILSPQSRLRRVGSHDGMPALSGGEDSRMDRDDAPVTRLAVTSPQQQRLCQLNALSLLLQALHQSRKAFEASESESSFVQLVDMTTVTWLQAQQRFVSEIANAVLRCVLPDVTQQQWKHFQPFYRGVKPTYAITSLHVMLRGLVFDLQLCSGLSRFKAPIPVGDVLCEAPSACRDRASSAHSTALAALPVQLLVSVLVRTLTPVIDVYVTLYPSRVRMEQYRIDVGYLLTVALSWLAHAALSTPLPTDCVAEVAGLTSKLERLLCVCGLMACDPAFALQAMAAVTERWGALPSSAPLPVAESAGLWQLPPGLSAFAAVYNVVCSSPISSLRTELQCNPVDGVNVLACCVGGGGSGTTTHDEFKSWARFPWAVDWVLQCGLSADEVVDAVKRRHELFAWEYPKLTPADEAAATAFARFDVLNRDASGHPEFK